MKTFNKHARQSLNRRVSATTLGLEILEDRSLLSASTLGDVAAIERFADVGEYSTLREIANVDLSSLSNATFDAANPIVTSTADDGAEGTLRHAIANAQDGATITIDSALEGRTITLLQGEIKINKSITIVSEAAVSIDARNESRVFTIVGTPVVEIEGLALLNGAADYGGAIFVDTIERPDDVSDVVALYDPDAASIDVTWTQDADADSYVVYVVVDGGAPQTLTVDDDGSSATLENVAPGSDYTFFVVAVNDGGESYPVVVSVKPIVATASEENGVVTVSIEPDGATAEYVWSYVDDNGETVVLDVVGSTYERDPATAGREIVVDVVGTGESANSGVTLTVAPAPPSAPQNLVATYNENAGVVTVTWTPEDDVLNYTISYLDSNGVSYGPFALGGATEYSTSNVPPGEVYTFAVVASNAGGDSAPSTVSCEVPGANIEVPSLRVTTGDDVVDANDGLVSLREALCYAKLFPELGDTITFASDVQTISLTSGELTLNSPIKIVSSDRAVTIDANGGSRILTVAAAATLDGLTLTNGAAGAQGGGAIKHLSGILTIKNSTFESNTADNGYGAAILQCGGNLDVSNSKIMANGSSTSMGAVCVGAGSAEFKSVLFAENLTGELGALCGASNTTTTIRNVTIANNDAGVNFRDGTAYLYNSLILDNNGKNMRFNNTSGAVDSVGSPDMANTWNWSGSIKHHVANNNNSWFFVNNESNILDDDYRIDVSGLQYDCRYVIDAGNNYKVTSDMTLDLSDGPRVFRFLSSTPKVDLGAYEARKDVPSGLVTTSSDVVDPFDGEISLREALMYLNPYKSGNSNPDYASDYIAQHGKVVRFAANLAGGVLTLDQGALNVAVDGLTIDGAYGGDRVTIDARNSSMIFDIKKYDSMGGSNIINVALKDLVLTNGASYWSGAVVFDSFGGSLAVDNVDFIGNGSSSAQGGALTLKEGDAYINDCAFTNNVGSEGGAIWIQNQNAGAIVIDGATFTNNAATNNGGAIYVQNASNVTVKNGAFTGNTAGDMGGVWVVQSNATVVFDNMTTTGNSAKNGGVGYVNGGSATYKNSAVTSNRATERGGAFYVNISSSDYLAAYNTTFSSNTAGIAGDVAYTPSGSAATIIGIPSTSNARFDDASERFVEAQRTSSAVLTAPRVVAARATLTLRNVLVQSSRATYDGGGVYLADADLNVYASVFDSNASYNGGGIYVDAGSLFVDGGEFVANVAEYGGGAVGLYPTADGGTPNDVYARISGGTSFTDNVAGDRGGAIYAKFATVDVEGGAFENNVATTSYGGAIYYGASEGGVSGGSFASNTAGKFGGAIYVYDSPITIVGGTDAVAFAQNAAMRGGAIYQSKNVVELANATFDQNEAIEQGGAIYTGNGATTNVSTATFSQNNSGLYGGAIALNRSTLNLTGGATFAENEATTGGAVYVYDGAVSGDGGVFVSNVAEKSGGAIYLEKASATLVAPSFVENAVGFYGNAIYDGAGSTATIFGGEFTENAGAKIGGAIFAYGSTLEIGLNGEEGTSFSNNASQRYGGAVSLSDGALATIAGATFDGNTTYKRGGAIYSSASNLTMTNVSVDNSSSESGGGIYLDGGTLELTDVDFAGNRATALNGGAIAARSNATIMIADGSFQGNVARKSGGAVMAYSSALETADVKFSQNEAKDGAAIFASFGGTERPIAIDGCAFVDNVATGSGGAILAMGAELNVSNQTSFVGNVANLGGAIYANKTTLDVVNASFLGNKANATGGAVYVCSEMSSATIVNALVAENEAPSASGLYFSYASYSIVNATVTANVGDVVLRSVNATNGSIVNSIIAGNSSDDVYLKGDLAADYVLSAFDGWTSGDNNIEFDPTATLFSDDYRLADGSPAIDAGDSDAVTTSFDLAGAARIVGSAVDLGAYEYAGSNATLATLDDAFADLFVEDVDVEL